MDRQERIEQVAEIIATGRLERKPVEALPPNLYPTWEDMYPIHDLVHEKLKLEVAGWKVGAADAEVRASEGYLDPIMGRIYRQAVFSSPAVFSSDKFINFRQFESEIVIQVNGSQLTSDREISADDIRQATVAVYPALEIGDIVFRDWYDSSPFWGTAIDNAGSGVLILGSSLPMEAFESLANIDVDLRVNGIIRKTGHSSKAMGDPLVSAAWIVNNVRARGFEIPDGTLLSTGTTTGHCFVDPGDVVNMDMGEVGSVEVRVEV